VLGEFLFMKFPFIRLLSSTVAILLLTSCERETSSVSSVNPDPASDTAAWYPVQEVLKAHVNAMNREDLPSFMSYLHPEHEGYLSTQAAARQLFGQYELSTTLEMAEPVVISEGQAKVKFVQVTKKINGPEFRDNRVTGIHTLRKDNGLWKIYSTESSEVIYLDQAKG
jgi:murein L,D-transpeptidase YcbB/YkuD